MRSEDLERIRGRCRVLAVNSSHAAVPWADALYAADMDWWRLYGPGLRFQGLKITGTAGAVRFAEGLRLVTIAREVGRFVDRFVFDPPGVIGGGGNSAFQALNLAVQFGARRVLLLGVDMRLGAHGEIHHHGPHPAALRNPKAPMLARWAGILDAAAPSLAARGVEVVNASPVSALAGFRRLAVKEALREW